MNHPGRCGVLEGAWWAGAGAYVVASYSRASDQGGAEAHDGQVWFYDPLGSTLTLQLAFGRATTPEVDGAFDGPDNISLSPYGGVIIAEDGEGIKHLVGASPATRSRSPGPGATTAPDGQACMMLTARVLR